MWFTET
ncbi:hypothetical protein LEMLEM_LOCUS22048 [Lemmus lemmus]